MESTGNEVSPKVFFSQGFHSLTMLNRASNLIKKDLDNGSTKALKEMGVSDEILDNLEKYTAKDLQRMAFESRIYYVADLKGTTREIYENMTDEEKEKIDYLSDDYNEEYFKRDANGNKTIPDPNNLVTPANMHTITGKSVVTEKIRKIINDNGKTATMLEVARALCDKYKEFYPSKELPVNIHQDGSKDDNFLEDMYLNLTPLQQREKELSELEKEARIISKAEALIDKQNAKEGQSIGDE